MDLDVLRSGCIKSAADGTARSMLPRLSTLPGTSLTSQLRATSPSEPHQADGVFDLRATWSTFPPTCRAPRVASDRQELAAPPAASPHQAQGSCRLPIAAAQHARHRRCHWVAHGQAARRLSRRAHGGLARRSLSVARVSPREGALPVSQGSGTWQPCTGKPNGVSVAPLYSGGARSWLQAAVAITGRYLLGLLPMGGVPFTTADDRQDGGRHGGFQPQRLTGPPVRAH